MPKVRDSGEPMIQMIQPVVLTIRTSASPWKIESMFQCSDACPNYSYRVYPMQCLNISSLVPSPAYKRPADAINVSRSTRGRIWCFNLRGRVCNPSQSGSRLHKYRGPIKRQEIRSITNEDSFSFKCEARSLDDQTHSLLHPTDQERARG